MRLIQITAVVAFMLGAVGVQAQSTYWVDNDDPNDPGPNDCDISNPLEDGSYSRPFDSIQEGLDACASTADEVRVKAGVYADWCNVNLDFAGKDIVLRSQSGNPSTVIIDGGGSDRAILFDDGETRDAQVLGIWMMNCYAAAVRCEYSNPTINNCRFTDNSAASGGAVYLVGSAPLFTGCDFYENSAALDGGAVYAAGSDAEFLNCYFYEYGGTQGNSADFGGALHAVSCPNLSLTNCHFNYNTASTDGGALYIDNHSNPSLANCSFELNSAAGDGGACFIDLSSDPTFSTCTFTENTADQRGGAIRSGDNSTATFDDCAFVDCSAGWGGGAIFGSDTVITINGGTFESNDAGTRGGALRIRDISSAVVTGTGFTDNEAGSGGGAIHSLESSVETSGCSFWTNVAGTNGGAIRSTGATSTAQVTSCDFTGNRADLNGGAIASADGSDVTVTGGNFTQNVAVGKGGGLASENATANVSGAQLEGNAAADGGGIANLDGPITVSGCDFIGNTVSLAGAGLLTDGGDATVSGSTFSDNIADYGGGGLFSFDSPSVTVEDSTFTHNWATGTPSYGGAIAIELGTLSLARCGFYEWNEAITGGGALSTRGASVFADDCDFGRDLVGNTAGSGGGVYHEGPGPDRAEYKWCRFVHNSASTGGGGGVALVDHHAMLHNCAFFGNESFATGGAIDAFAMVDTSLELANCVFSGNTTDVAGGAVRVSNNGAITTATIANGTFSRNVATNLPWGAGGGLWLGGTGPSNVGIDNSIFWENQDAAGNVFSAQIFREGTSPCVVTFDNSCFTNPACPPAADLRPIGTNICDDPRFADPNGPDGVCGTEDDNLHLLTASNCVDAADNTAVPADTLNLDDDSSTTAHTPLDLDAKQRFIEDPTAANTGVPCTHYPDGEIVDMGSYERCPGDIDGDGDTDHGDLGALLSAWCSVAGDPKWNPNADLDGDGHVGHGDLGVLLADWGCGT